MTDNFRNLVEKLGSQRLLSLSEYEQLVEAFSPETAAFLAEKADSVRRSVYGNSVFIRGLIEIGNICKNDCLYCGIRASNKKCERYRLTKEQILACCAEGYPLGFRTFVLQGGEDPFFSDEFVCDVVEEIKKRYPDCAVTLSLGERSEESYRAFRKAGADRYLLRHETATKEHYELLHPDGMSFDNRMKCLETLKNLGFQTGCGFMVGSPYQTSAHIAADLKFIEEFRPQMCGIGPFIPHKDTPFADKQAGTAELTCYLLSIVRLMLPQVLLPATTALGSIRQGGREEGIKAGANVVMPNLSPNETKEKYMLYNNKLSSGSEAAANVAALAKQMESVGYRIVTDRGDYKA